MKPRFLRTSAFSLVEVTLALGIAAFGLVSIFGLLPASLGTSQTSVQQTSSVNVLAGIAADLRQAPTANQILSGSAAGSILTAASPRYGVNVANTTGAPAKITPFYLDEGGNSAALSAARYQVNITINPANPSLPRAATTGIIQISWPAAATPPNVAGSLTTFVALDRN